jgi:hypothetical protein
VLPQLNDDKIDVQALTEAHYSAITGGNEIMADKRIVLFCAGGMSTSLLVNKVKVAQSNIFKSQAETLGHAYWRHLNSPESVFASVKDSPRYAAITERLAKL